MAPTHLKISIIGLRGYPSDYSGIERVAEELIPALISKGHQITIFSRNKKYEEAHAHRNDLSIIRTSYIPISSLETLSHAVFSFCHIIAHRKKPDVIYLQALAPGMLSFFCRMISIPSVVAIQGLDWKRAKWKGAGSFILKLSEKVIVKFANEIIVVSKELQDYYYGKYGRVTHLIPNAIDFKKQNERTDDRYPVKHNIICGKYVLCCSRLVPEKRIEDVIKAFTRLNTDYSLIITGTGPKKYRKFLFMLAAHHQRIHFIGHQQRNQIRELIRNAHFIVSASELEGMPLSLIEAIAMAIPVVVSDIKPHQELFEGQKNAFFITKDVDDLFRKMDEVMANYSEFRQQALFLNCKSSYQNVHHMIEQIECVLANVKNHKRS